MKILELFGGIGACTEALKKIGIDFEIADYVEVDKYAVRSYNAINNTNFKPQDICEWDKDIEVDLIMHGSPCQDFSTIGKQIGADINSNTRSSLMYETIRIVKNIKPKYVIWENVKNILGDKHRHNFKSYLEIMESLGYANYYQVLDAKDYGIPQNRQRLFTVSIRNDIDKQYEFPLKQNLQLNLKDLLEDMPNDKYYLKESTVHSYTNITKQQKEKGNGFRFEVSDGNVIAKTITTKAGGRMTDNFIRTDKGVRKLTPKECWRLMGFSDDSFEKASEVNSDTQLFKQAGNSIVVDVLVNILNNLFDIKI